MLISLSGGSNASAILVVLDVHLALIQIGGRPAFLEFVKIGGDRNNGVSWGSHALGGVPIAEAGCATKSIVLVQIEEAWLASMTEIKSLAEILSWDCLLQINSLIAASALHILLAEADSSLGIAGGCILMGSPTVASALLASMGTELVVVVIAAVALVASHTRLTLALAVAVALQRSGANGIAGAVDAVAIVAHIEVLLAAFAVGSIAILAAVQAVTSMTRPIEQIRVEEALVRQSIAVAS